MKLIKDCADWIKGRCKKTGQYCCGLADALLNTCPLPQESVKKATKKGKEKR